MSTNKNFQPSVHARRFDAMLYDDFGMLQKNKNIVRNLYIAKRPYEYAKASGNGNTRIKAL